MNTTRTLAEQFEANRRHLQNVAYRILGSRTEADDAVQEAWLRLTRTDTAELENVRAWLTTVVGRLCLDMLRARKSRAEEPLAPTAIETRPSDHDAERDLELADSVGLALLVVLDSLAPAERVCFVLHDLFNLSFGEIAPIVNRSSAAARQLASRARRRVQGSAHPDDDLARRRDILNAFLEASREGNFSALLALLDPEVTLRADRATLERARQHPGAPELMPEMHGGTVIAKIFEGRARNCRPALIDGAPGLVIAPDDHIRLAMEFIIEHDRVTEIDLIADPSIIERLQISFS